MKTRTATLTCPEWLALASATSRAATSKSLPLVSAARPTAPTPLLLVLTRLLHNACASAAKLTATLTLMLTGSTYVRPDTDLAADGIQAASTCDSTTNGCCSAPGAYAGDAACCAEWLQLDTEDATIAVDGFTCESLFAPGRLYAGMCDIACGYCNTANVVCNDFAGEASVEDNSCTACTGPAAADCTAATCAAGYNTYSGGTCVEDSNAQPQQEPEPEPPEPELEPEPAPPEPELRRPTSGAPPL